MKIDYIIIQAGGKGTRLEHLTKNKPKAIVPVENLPMIFYLFRKYPDKKYIIIADYKKEVLRAYLESFAQVRYQVIDGEGVGTCGGMRDALSLLPVNTPFLLMWSDLILSDCFTIPEEENNYIGISQTFPCRWKYQEEEFYEEASREYGVAGLFIFKNKALLEDIPKEGELVRWLSGQKISFKPLGLGGTREFGTLKEYNGLENLKTRPFNSIKAEGDTIIKEPTDEQGRALAEREKNWYRFATENQVAEIPKIYKYDPLTMERIKGKNIYEIEASEEKLSKIVEALKNLHSVKTVNSDSFSVKEAYYYKTMDRLDKIRNLIPLGYNDTILINGRRCRNVFFYRYEFEKLLDSLYCDKFTFIHGDCTFSNLMLRESSEPVFIDPRGYFGYTELYGDPNYDWAKLYYSIAGNYDRFNLKEFKLDILDDKVELLINSNGWEHLADIYLEMAGVDKRKIKLIHAVIWLSLTTYAWQDYDSICGAFYNGLYHLEECWE